MEYTTERDEDGSVRILKRPTGKFAVEIPSARTPDEAASDISNAIEMKPEFRPRKILLRADMAEDSAGQLYSYIYRVLYGWGAKEQMRALCNSGVGKEKLIKDTLHSFGVQQQSK